MRITPQQAKKMMEEQTDAVILDVRERSEYRQGHIMGAELLPLGSIDEYSTAEIIPNMDTPLLVYCHSGRRSATACQLLEALGYTKIYDFGGILDWTYDITT